MPSIIHQAGYAISTFEFTPETPSLPVGLVMLATFSAAMIIIEAVRYHFSQKITSVVNAMPTEIEYRKAA
jgi:hypothetical protein